MATCSGWCVHWLSFGALFRSAVARDLVAYPERYDVSYDNHLPDTLTPSRCAVLVDRYMIIVTASREAYIIPLNV